MKDIYNRRDFFKNISQLAIALSIPSIYSNVNAASLSDCNQHISIFSKHLQWLDYQSMSDAIAEMGFNGVDLTVRPKGHVLPERVEEDLPKAAEACKNSGIDLLMITTAIKDVDEPMTKKILKTASKCGVKYYRTNWYPYDDSKDFESNLILFKEKLERLAELNNEYGLKGAYQNHAGIHFGSSVWDLGMVLNQIKNDGMGMQYDICHATTEGNQAWPVGFKFALPFINSIDIKDFKWEKQGNVWKKQFVPLGEGMVDFKKFFSLIEKNNIRVPFSLHYEYKLGGAEHGARKLSISRKEVLKKMKSDLDLLKSYMQ